MTKFFKQFFQKERPSTLVRFDELKAKAAARNQRLIDIHAKADQVLADCESAKKKFCLTLSEEDLSQAIEVNEKSKRFAEFVRDNAVRMSNGNEFFADLNAREIIHAALCTVLNQVGRNLDQLALEEKKRNEAMGLDVCDSPAILAVRKDLDRLRAAKDDCENGLSDIDCFQRFSALINF